MDAHGKAGPKAGPATRSRRGAGRAQVRRPQPRQRCRHGGTRWINRKGAEAEAQLTGPRTRVSNPRLPRPGHAPTGPRRTILWRSPPKLRHSGDEGHGGQSTWPRARGRGHGAAAAARSRAEWQGVPPSQPRVPVSGNRSPLPTSSARGDSGGEGGRQQLYAHAKSQKPKHRSTNKKKVNVPPNKKNGISEPVPPKYPRCFHDIRQGDLRKRLGIKTKAKLIHPPPAPTSSL